MIDYLHMPTKITPIKSKSLRISLRRTYRLQLSVHIHQTPLMQSHLSLSPPFPISFYKLLSPNSASFFLYNNSTNHTYMYSAYSCVVHRKGVTVSKGF